MKKNLALVPAVLLSSALLLTACSSGSPAANNNATDSSVNSSTTQNGSSAPTNQTNPSASAVPTAIAGYVAPPQTLGSDYKQFFRAFSMNDPRMLDAVKASGATTSKDDPAIRPMSVSDYESMKADQKQRQQLIKTNWEIQSDYETTAQNVSDALKKNPNASLDNLKADKSLVVNRYANVGSMNIEQDNETKFFFVIFRVNDQNFKGVPMGVLVPQAGKTPDFTHKNGPETTVSK